MGQNVVLFFLIGCLIFIALTELYNSEVISIFIILFQNSKDRRSWTETVFGPSFKLNRWPGPTFLFYWGQVTEDWVTGTEGPKNMTGCPPLFLMRSIARPSWTSQRSIARPFSMNFLMLKYIPRRSVIGEKPAGGFRPGAFHRGVNVRGAFHLEPDVHVPKQTFWDVSRVSHTNFMC